VQPAPSPLIPHFLFYSSTHHPPPPFKLEVCALKVLNIQLNYEAEVLGALLC